MGIMIAIGVFETQTFRNEITFESVIEESMSTPAFEGICDYDTYNSKSLNHKAFELLCNHFPEFASMEINAKNSIDKQLLKRISSTIEELEMRGAIPKYYTTTDNVLLYILKWIQYWMVYATNTHGEKANIMFY